MCVTARLVLIPSMCYAVQSLLLASRWLVSSADRETILYSTLMAAPSAVRLQYMPQPKVYRYQIDVSSTLDGEVIRESHAELIAITNLKGGSFKLRINDLPGTVTGGSQDTRAMIRRLMRHTRYTVERDVKGFTKLTVDPSSNISYMPSATQSYGQFIGGVEFPKSLVKAGQAWTGGRSQTGHVVYRLNRLERKSGRLLAVVKVTGLTTQSSSSVELTRVLDVDTGIPVEIVIHSESKSKFPHSSMDVSVRLSGSLP